MRSLIHPGFSNKPKSHSISSPVLFSAKECFFWPTSDGMVRAQRNAGGIADKG